MFHGVQISNWPCNFYLEVIVTSFINSCFLSDTRLRFQVLPPSGYKQHVDRVQLELFSSVVMVILTLLSWWMSVKKQKLFRNETENIDLVSLENIFAKMR